MCGAIATATALAVWAPAQAQERPLAITLSADVEHHDNAARASAAQAALRGLERSDTIFRPAIGITLQKTAGLATFDLDANLGYDFYARNTQLNREHLSLAGTISATGWR
jgi:hypothetical protein